MLAVQVVKISWTKATRGAPHSNMRSALPRAFPIDAGTATCIVQHHRMAEWEGFEPRMASVVQLQNYPGSVDALRIVAGRQGAFELGFIAGELPGQPRRHSIPAAVVLLPGQYARLSMNARHTSSHGQHYTETIFLVACGEAMPANRFTQAPPDHEIDLKDDLF